MAARQLVPPPLVLDTAESPWPGRPLNPHPHRPAGPSLPHPSLSHTLRSLPRAGPRAFPVSGAEQVPPHSPVPHPGPRSPLPEVCSPAHSCRSPRNSNDRRPFQSGHVRLSSSASWSRAASVLLWARVSGTAALPAPLPPPFGTDICFPSWVTGTPGPGSCELQPAGDRRSPPKKVPRADNLHVHIHQSFLLLGQPQAAAPSLWLSSGDVDQRLFLGATEIQLTWRFGSSGPKVKEVSSKFPGSWNIQGDPVTPQCRKRWILPRERADLLSREITSKLLQCPG